MVHLHSKDTGALSQVSPHSQIMERLREIFWEPSHCQVWQVNCPSSPVPTRGSSRITVLEIGAAFRAGDPWNQLSCAGGMM